MRTHAPAEHALRHGARRVCRARGGVLRALGPPSMPAAALVLARRSTSARPARCWPTRRCPTSGRASRSCGTGGRPSSRRTRGRATRAAAGRSDGRAANLGTVHLIHSFCDLFNHLDWDGRGTGCGSSGGIARCPSAAAAAAAASRITPGLVCGRPCRLARQASMLAPAAAAAANQAWQQGAQVCIQRGKSAVRALRALPACHAQCPYAAAGLQ